MANFMNFPTSRERVLTCGNTTIGVIPDICLVSHFQVGSWQVLYRPTETGNVKRWGLPLMIPNFSRLKDGIFKEKGTTLPIHGFGRNLPWTVIEMEDTNLAMQLSSSDATRTDYPYEFVFTANIAVDEGTLTYTLTMENHSHEDMPIAPGFHPYFAVAQSEKGEVVTDVRFPTNGTLIIRELPQNGEYALANIQVWSEPPGKPDHDFICFEPTVGSEDALNRPADRLTIEPQSSRQIVLQLQANPL